MKKIFTTLILFFILTLNVKAINVDDCILSANGVKNAGDTLEASVSIKISGLDPNSTTSDGILIVGYEIDYDESLLTLTEVNAKPVFNSLIETEDNEKVIISHVQSGLTTSNTCYDNVLFCGNYYATLKFKVGNPNVSNTKIAIKNITIGYGRINSIVTEDDVSYLETNKSSSATVNFNINSNNNSNTAIKENTTKNETTKKDNKSNNNYLNKLEIEGYNINFDKNKNDYSIQLKDEDNTLKINTEAEDKKASINIIGADDLKSNNYKVIIKVTSENNEERIYQINAYNKKENMVYKNKTENKKNNFKFNIKYIIIIGVILLSLIIILTIIYKLKDKKIDKALNELDNF